MLRVATTQHFILKFKWTSGSEQRLHINGCLESIVGFTKAFKPLQRVDAEEENY